MTSNEAEKNKKGGGGEEGEGGGGEGEEGGGGGGGVLHVHVWSSIPCRGHDCLLQKYISSIVDGIILSMI